MERLKKWLMIVVILVMAEISTIDTCAAPARDITADTMLAKINSLRESYGLDDLKMDPELVMYAQIRAEEVSREWSHTRPDGTEGLDLIPLSREWAGENLSKYATSPDECNKMFALLKASPTHMENMVEAEYVNIGIASFEKGGITYVAYMFSN